MKLVVYDVLSREVAVLVNEEKTDGIHTTTWDGSGFPGGAYFCKLSVPTRRDGTAGTFSHTNKLLLLK